MVRQQWLTSGPCTVSGLGVRRSRLYARTMIDLAVFDMAGTTIDDGGVVYRALSAAVTSAGATVDPTDLQTWMGTDKVTAITALLPLGGVTATDSLVASCFATFKSFLDDAYRDRTAHRLRRGRRRDRRAPLARHQGRADHGLRSRGDRWHPVVDRLGRSGQDLDAVVTTSDVASGRPAPYMIHHAMELTGVTSVASVLAAGDTLVDLEAARNAGAIAVGVLTGALSEAALAQGPHDYILAGVAEIPSLDECQPVSSAAASPAAASPAAASPAVS